MKLLLFKRNYVGDNKWHAQQFGHSFILVESGLPWQDHGEEQQELPIITGDNGEQKKSLSWRIKSLASQVCWHVPTEAQVFYIS